MRAKLFGGVVGALVIALAGCSADAKPANANDSDIGFSVQMIPHHGQSLQLAELVPERAADPFVKQLADKIKTEETAEIEKMSGWLRSWNVAVPPTTTHSGHAMEGMLSADDINNLRPLSGAEFDKQWLTTLAKHLRSGVAMARNLQASKAIHEPTRDMAREIIVNQGAEITQIDQKTS